jgi:hypothetical protein
LASLVPCTFINTNDCPIDAYANSGDIVNSVEFRYISNERMKHPWIGETPIVAVNTPAEIDSWERLRPVVMSTHPKVIWLGLFMNSKGGLLK